MTSAQNKPHSSLQRSCQSRAWPVSASVPGPLRPPSPRSHSAEGSPRFSAAPAELLATGPGFGAARRRPRLPLPAKHTNTRLTYPSMIHLVRSLNLNIQGRRHRPQLSHFRRHFRPRVTGSGSALPRRARLSPSGAEACPDSLRPANGRRGMAVKVPPLPRRAFESRKHLPAGRQWGGRVSRRAPREGGVAVAVASWAPPAPPSFLAAPGAAPRLRGTSPGSAGLRGTPGACSLQPGCCIFIVELARGERGLQGLQGFCKVCKVLQGLHGFARFCKALQRLAGSPPGRPPRAREEDADCRGWGCKLEGKSLLQFKRKPRGRDLNQDFCFSPPKQREG